MYSDIQTVFMSVLAHTVNMLYTSNKKNSSTIAAGNALVHELVVKQLCTLYLLRQQLTIAGRRPKSCVHASQTAVSRRKIQRHCFKLDVTALCEGVC